ncbi:MAG: hypothetical protein ABW046_16420 [Actinoplanes sp.]
MPVLPTCRRWSVLAAVTVVVLSTFLAGSPASAVRDRIRLAPTFNGGVYSVAHHGNTVYVGGAFTSATVGHRSHPRKGLAAFDARTGALLPWAPAADGAVRALVYADDSVFAAGDFHTVSGQKRDSLVRLHAGTGAVRSFAHTVSGTTYALAAGHGRLYLGGSFTDVDGRKRANTAAFSLATGALDYGWRPIADDTVHAIAVTGRRVYLGGGFHTVDAVKGTLRLAAVHAVTGVVDPGFRAKLPAEVRAIAVDRAGVYVATAGVGGRAIAFNTAGVLRWQRVFDGDAAAIAVMDGVTYVGGHFDSACLTSKNGIHGVCTDGSEPRLKLAAIGSTGQLGSWRPAANGVIGARVLSVNRSTGTLYVGGDFTTIGGVGRSRFAAF